MQTPTELRGSGGVVGNYGVVTATNGKLALPVLKRISDIPTEAAKVVKAPADYLARYGERFNVANRFQNVTASPDFPSVAAAVESLAPQIGIGEVDGVVAIDPDGLVALLKLTGPVTVAEWPEPITADNARQLLLHEQYVRFPHNDRVIFLASVANAVFARLTAGDLAALPTVIGAVGPAVAERHILFASTDAAAQRLLVDSGAGGAFPRTDGDLLGVVAHDATESKLDYFLSRTITSKVSYTPDTGRVRSRVTVKLANAASAGLPDAVAGPGGNVANSGDNQLYISVYSPLYLRGARMGDAAIGMASEKELGVFVYSAVVVVPAGGDVTLSLDLEGAVAPHKRYRLALFHQATVNPDEVRLEVSRAGGSGTATRRFTQLRSRDLSVDPP